MNVPRLLVSVLLLLAATAAAQPGCTLGNLDPVISWEPGWLQAGDAFAQFAPPDLGDCACDVGYQVTEIRCPLVFSGPTQVTAQAQLMNAVRVGDCPAPNQVVAASDPVVLNLEAGLQTVAVPCAFDCTIISEDFFLVLRLTAADAVVELPFTGTVTGIGKNLPGDPCTSYRDRGAGWQDLVAAGLNGGVPITAAAECCGVPIGDDEPSWGALKKSYR